MSRAGDAGSFAAAGGIGGERINHKTATHLWVK